MGALTDNRKRRFIDCLFSSSSPSFPHSELSPGAPLLKKPKIFSLPSVPHRGAAPPPPKQQAHLKLRSFPPAAPLPRPVHGPQRILKAFRLGSSGAYIRTSSEQVSGKERDAVMGNVTSRILKRTADAACIREKREAPSVSGRDARSNDGSPKGLELEDYKKLVEGAREEYSTVSELRRSADMASGKVVFPLSMSSVVSDLRILTRKEEEVPESHVLKRKVADATRLVDVESTPVREEGVWAKRTPLYKDLLNATSRKYDSRLRSLDFEVKLAEKKISEFRIASDVKPKEDLLGPFTPLTDEEENVVNLALRDPDKFHLWRREVLVTHESSNIEITREVIQCLRPGAWLNDEVINLYFELLKEREKRDPTKFLKCHFFNTFFYKKLISGRDGYDFKAVRRWTTQRKIGYDLIECDKIFVPIHKEIHWCLAVIIVKDEKLLYIDSLGGMDVQVLKVLSRYFMDEVKDKSNKIINVTSWKLEPVDDLPLQRNGWDCGMFMLKYADFYSRGLGLCFGQENMIYFRKRTAKEILRLRAD